MTLDSKAPKDVNDAKPVCPAPFSLTTVTHRAAVVVVGGGVAGSRAAILLAESGLNVILLEKAFIERSGCLAPGVNALNAYIGYGKTPIDYVDYATNDAHSIARKDLLLSMSKLLNEEALWLESIGLAIHKDSKGRYLERSWRNIQVNGGDLKPLIAKATRAQEKILVLEQILATHILTSDNKALGVMGLNLKTGKIVEALAPAVIIATGGAAGLYRPANPPESQNRIWYSPFNVGSGLAMGLRAGAEMTTLEMRFVALRVADTLAPTGTLALGVGASQLNAKNQAYEAEFGHTTSQRVLAFRRQIQRGLGPCSLTAACDPESRARIYRAYLNMCPSQTLQFLESERALKGQIPDRLTTEIAASEPLVQGGHTAGGYWVERDRRTTIEGLWAIGDVAGGCPQKYVTGSLAEANIAATAIAELFKTGSLKSLSHPEDQPLNQELDPELNQPLTQALAKAHQEITRFSQNEPSLFTAKEITQAARKVLDIYAGGIAAGYAYSFASLTAAESRLTALMELTEGLKADSPQTFAAIWEVKDRLLVSLALVAHLKARKETRWPGFGEYLDYPVLDDSLGFVNSRLTPKGIEIIHRPIYPNGLKSEKSL
ncbi:MAG: adenylyl-sulfate reductase subunit alpha [Deltaproteobacteria bacterium]|jgi:adenylylsulfate reductase subunit A|nr:adenylyl-sulfate reductase subunit alpha [Deltaproteobacteria bacterium]